MKLIPFFLRYLRYFKLYSLLLQAPIFIHYSSQIMSSTSGFTEFVQPSMPPKSPTPAPSVVSPQKTLPLKQPRLPSLPSAPNHSPTMTTHSASHSAPLTSTGSQTKPMMEMTHLSASLSMTLKVAITTPDMSPTCSTGNGTRRSRWSWLNTFGIAPSISLSLDVTAKHTQRKPSPYTLDKSPTTTAA